MKRVLALDIATTTGFAVDRPGGGDKPLTGTFRSEHDGDDLGQAYVEFEQQLCDLIAVHAPEVLTFEAALVIGGKKGTTRPTNIATVRKLFGLSAVAELVGTRANLEVYEAHIQTVRRHFVGNGRAEKPEIYDRCKLLGWDVRSMDASDAAAIWDYTRHTLRVPTANVGPMFAGVRA
jgi:Holliday junction resolvasome RuvABC endonuclease subunit